METYTKEKNKQYKKNNIMNKSKQHVEQDYARNAIYDKKHGFGKEGDYEAKQLAKVSSGSATYKFKRTFRFTNERITVLYESTITWKCFYWR